MGRKPPRGFGDNPKAGAPHRRMSPPPGYELFVPTGDPGGPSLGSGNVPRVPHKGHGVPKGLEMSPGSQGCPQSPTEGLGVSPRGQGCPQGVGVALGEGQGVWKRPLGLGVTTPQPPALSPGLG